MSAFLSRVHTRPLPGIGVNRLSPTARDILMFCPFTQMGGPKLHDIIGSRQFSVENWDPKMWIGSPRGGALAFNGSNQYATLDESLVPDVSDHFTLYVRILIRSRSNWDSYFGRSSNTNWSNGYGFWFDNGYYRFFAGHYSQHRSSIPIDKINFDEWYDFFGVLNKDKVLFTAINDNGELIKGAEDTYDGDNLNAGNITIGGSFGGYNDRSDCCVESVAIWDRAFTQENILEFWSDRTSFIARTRNLFVSAAAPPETGLLTVGANAGLVVGGLAGGLGSFTVAAQADENMVASAAAGGTLTASAQAGESMAALAAAAAEMDAGAVAGEAMAALAAAAAAIIADAEAGDTWTTGATGQLTVGAQAGESFAAAAAAYGALVGAVTASEAVTATAAALAAMVIDAEAGDTFLPDSSAEGGIVLRGAIRIQAALRGEVDVKPLLRGLPSIRPH